MGKGKEVAGKGERTGVTEGEWIGGIIIIQGIQSLIFYDPDWYAVDFELERSVI